MWDGPKQFCIFAALREAKVTIQEFDSQWVKKISSLRTESDKMAFVRLLKQAGFGRGHFGDRDIARHLKVRFVNAIVGRSTDAPAPPTTRCSTKKQVGIYVCVFLYTMGVVLYNMGVCFI